MTWLVMWVERAPRIRLISIPLAVALTMFIAGTAYAWNCVNAVKADSYWGEPPPHGSVAGGHYDDANLHCTARAGLKYTCPDQAKYPVNQTAEVGAILAIAPDSNDPNLVGQPGTCGQDKYNGHVGIVVGVRVGSIDVYEEGWPAEPATHTHTYPCGDKMWFIHKEGSGPPPPPTTDVDNDGVTDVNDLCRTEAEDIDGIDDADGCPEDLSADVNGDGRDDAIVVDAASGTWNIGLSTGSGLAGFTKWAENHGAGLARRMLADVNGDGRDDAIVFFPNGDWHVGISTGSGFSGLGSGQWASNHGANSTNQFLKDVNGDGKADAVVFFSDGEWWVGLSSGTNFDASGSGLWALNHGAGSTRQFLTDVDGDGRADAVVYFPNGDWWAGLAGAVAFNSPNSGHWAVNHGAGSAKQFLADVNGDGKSDAVVRFGDGDWWVGLAATAAFDGTGSGRWALNHGVGSSHQFVEDVNGDGRADAIVDFASGDWWVGLANESSFDGFGSGRWAVNHGAGLTYHEVSDVTGDGSADAVVYEPGTRCWWVGTSLGTTFAAVGNSNWACGLPGTNGDLDGDAMPDTYENAHGCLDPSVMDANVSADADGLANVEEMGNGTDPCASDTDSDACGDGTEFTLVPAINPLDPWDFFSVPVPALIAASPPAPDPMGRVRDSAVGAGDAQAVFAYFKAGAKTGKPVYDQDLNGNGVADGIEYDRTVVGPGHSGAPDGAVSATDAQLAFAQFKAGYHC